MPRFVHNVSNLIGRVLFLARPYGRAKLGGVFSLSFAQAVFQVIGITSIFPFLALAADPERIRRSQFGTRFLSLFPPMENRQLLLVAGLIAIVALLLSNAVLLPLLDTVARVLTAVLLLVTLFLVQPVIALSAAIVLGAYYVIIFRLLARKRREMDEGLRTSVAGSYREAQQMLGGIKPVKIHRAEEH